jgi:hypothetical protein
MAKGQLGKLGYRFTGMLSDLEIAKEYLTSESKTLVLAKDGGIIASSSGRGIADLVGFVETLRDELAGASMADKVVGKAVALLVRYAGIVAVHAGMMSESAKKALEGTEISYCYAKLVPRILNRAGDDLCPMEKLSLAYDDPTEGVMALKALVTKMANIQKDTTEAQ